VGCEVLDLCGQWIGPTQNRLADLARELGVKTFPQYHTGRKLRSSRSQTPFGNARRETPFRVLSTSDGRTAYDIFSSLATFQQCPD
jgi:monoamine oxidase